MSIEQYVYDIILSNHTARKSSREKTSKIS